MSGSLIRITLFALVTLSLSACDRREVEAPPILEPLEEPEELQLPDPALEAATGHAWQFGIALLEEAHQAATRYHQTTETFLAAPDVGSLEQLRRQWHLAHRQWLQLSPLLALADSHPGLFGALGQVRYNIDAHPIQPGYLDYLEDYPYSGIVNDMTVELTASNLRRQHGLTDDSDISLGFHALEFLLWGEDGARPPEDYEERLQASAEEREMGLTPVDLPNNRRRSLLLLLSHLLQDDLLKLHQHWGDPYGPVANPFYQLHARSRLQLLKDASKQLLTQDLAGILEAGTDSHNYREKDLSRLPVALGAIGEFWTWGEEPLLDRLGDDDARDRWREQLHQLQELTAGIKPGSADLSALRARVLALADIFDNPVEP